MKSKLQVFRTFLAIATVEILALFIGTGIARTEQISLHQQDFDNYFASLSIAIDSAQLSEDEQRGRDFFLGSTTQTEPSVTEENFGSYSAVLPIEIDTQQLSAIEQRFHNYLIASVDNALPAPPAPPEENFSNYLAALPTDLTPAPLEEAEQNFREYIMVMLTQTQAADSPIATDPNLVAPPQTADPSSAADPNLVAPLQQPPISSTASESQEIALAPSEAKFEGYLASLPTEQASAPLASEQNFSEYLALLPENVNIAPPEAAEQNFREYLVSLLSAPQSGRSPQAEPNYTYDVPAEENVKLSAGQQSYADYLVALRQEQESSSEATSASPEAEKSSTSTLKILAPKPNELLRIPSTRVTVQYPLGSQVELLSNGIAVEKNLIGGTETNHQTKIITQTWYGVSLNQGENTIAAQIKVNGSVKEVTSIKVFVRGTAKKLSIKTVETRIPADGHSLATVEGELLDDRGYVSSQEALVTLAASAGEFVGVDAKPNVEGFQVETRQGKFTAQLRSGLQAGNIVIRAKTSDLEAFTPLQFETNLRSSIVTGVIDFRIGGGSTNFYQSFRDFLPPGADNDTQLDFHAGVFATGKIGEWLFTGAYNSDRTLNQKCDGTSSLFREQQVCERNYPVYGDDSKTEATTPSQDSLYLRFERSAQIPGAEPDFAMWGDYNTKEFARSSQEYTATSRNLHGFKANYNIGNLQVTGFYGDNVEGFQRDTIAPDGTSGYYFLSRRLLISGSEDVTIELEELNRPGTVLERQQLIRGSDYEIDYDRGTILFREPILRTAVDDNGLVLVRRIVVTYQFESTEKDNYIYGGRLQYNFARELNTQSWLGATYVKENYGVRDFELYGADAQIAIGQKAHLIAEYAHSQNDSEMMGEVSGSAYRLEAEGEITPGIQGRAYLRSTDTGFANNATTSFVPGQTRYGAQITGQVASTTNVRLQYDHEDNRGIAPQPLDNFTDLFSPRTEAVPGSKVDNSLTTITAGVQQQIGKADLTVDWVHRHREDRIEPNALSSTSDQLRSRLKLPLTETLTFLAQNELTISNEEDAVYPDRTILGLDWKVAPDLSIRLAQQFSSGSQSDGNSITSLDFIGERKFGSDTTFNGRYSILNGGNGMTMQGAIGLKQGWAITPSLKLDLTYEHIFGSSFKRTGAGTQFAQPFTSGQSASSIGFDSGDSYSIGLAYKPSSDLQASARYEHRTSSGGANTVISADVTGKISPALTGLVRYQQANSANQRLGGLGNTANLKVGLAYRDPNSDKFNALLRYEYRKNPSTIPETILLGSGTGSNDHTFALETIYAPNWRWELYGKYAIRHSTSYLAEDLVNSSTVNLGQLRATYRLGYKVDLVGEARWINQPSENHSETGFVAEAGYYLTPNLRLSAGYAFGNVNDADFSGSRSAGGAYFGLTIKLNELFDGFGLQKPVPAPPKKSKVQPVAKRSSESKIPPTPLKKGGESQSILPHDNSEAIAPTPLKNEGDSSVTPAPANPEAIDPTPVEQGGDSSVTPAPANPEAIDPTPVEQGGESSSAQPQDNSNAIAPTSIPKDEEKSTQIQSQTDSEAASTLPARLRGK